MSSNEATVRTWSVKPFPKYELNIFKIAFELYYYWVHKGG